MLLANLKVTLKSMIVNPMTAIMMVLFPILMVFVLSMSQEGMYAHDIKDLNITYRIIDEDKTQLSQNLGYAFQSPQLHGVVKQSDEPDFTITIPKGYNEALLKKEDLRIQIDGIADASTYQGELLSAIIAIFNNEIQNHLGVGSALEENRLTPEQSSKLQTEYQKLLTERAIEKVKYTPAVTLTAKQSLSTQYLQMVFLVFITGYAASYKQMTETSDLELRMAVVPQTEWKKQISEMVSGFAQVFIFAVLYVVLVRLIGWGFPGKLAQYLLALLFASAFISAVAMLITAILPPKYSTAMTTILMMFIMFFGGMTGPAKIMYRGTPFEALGNAEIGQIMTKPFTQINIAHFDYQSLSLFAIGTVVCLIGVTLITKLKKGGNS